MKVDFVKFQLIHVKIIHVKIQELVFVQFIIIIFVVFVQQVIQVEHVKFIFKIIVHLHHVFQMQHVKIYLMVIDVFVHRMIHVIKQKLKIQLVQNQIIILINVSMGHVSRRNVLVFLVGQEISVQKILMNVEVIHAQIKELVM